MAEVIPLPGARVEAVSNIRWRGPFPKCVTKLGRLQAQKRHEQDLQRWQALRTSRVRAEDGGLGGAGQDSELWPFPGIENFAERYNELDLMDRGEIQGKVREALERIEMRKK